jgi:hypothetical protein
MVRLSISNHLGQKRVRAIGCIRALGRYGEFVIGDATVFIVNENGAWIDIDRQREGVQGEYSPIYLVGDGDALVTFLEGITDYLKDRGQFRNLNDNAHDAAEVEITCRPT